MTTNSITLDTRAALNAAIAQRRAVHRAHIMAALTALAQRTDPLTEHGGLLLEALDALARGGVDVAGLIDCVMAEAEPSAIALAP